MEGTPEVEEADRADPRTNPPTSNPCHPHKESSSWEKNPKRSQETEVKPRTS